MGDKNTSCSVLVDSPNGCDSRAWSRLTPGSRNLSQVSHVGNDSVSTGGCLLPSQTHSRNGSRCGADVKRNPMLQYGTWCHGLQLNLMYHTMGPKITTAEKKKENFKSDTDLKGKVKNLLYV